VFRRFQPCQRAARTAIPGPRFSTITSSGSKRRGVRARPLSAGCNVNDQTQATIPVRRATICRSPRQRVMRSRASSHRRTRWSMFEQTAAQARRAAERRIAETSRPSRGRPTRTDIERSAIVAALAKYGSVRAACRDAGRPAAGRDVDAAAQKCRVGAPQAGVAGGHLWAGGVEVAVIIAATLPGSRRREAMSAARGA
jgi:hypothetical protein